MIQSSGYQQLSIDLDNESFFEIKEVFKEHLNQTIDRNHVMVTTQILLSLNSF